MFWFSESIKFRDAGGDDGAQGEGWWENLQRMSVWPENRVPAESLFASWLDDFSVDLSSENDGLGHFGPVIISNKS